MGSYSKLTVYKAFCSQIQSFGPQNAFKSVQVPQRRANANFAVRLRNDFKSECTGKTGLNQIFRSHIIF